MTWQPANFRDVGESLALLSDTDSPISPGRLYRGGAFDELAHWSELGRPRTIINLRRGPDPTHLRGVRSVHIPAENSIENYQTSQPRVRVWLGRVLSCLASKETNYPVYLHCSSGKDRTGIVVAAILVALRVPTDLIVSEYLLSAGAEERDIRHALVGLRAPEAHRGELVELERDLREALE